MLLLQSTHFEGRLSSKARILEKISLETWNAKVQKTIEEIIYIAENISMKQLDLLEDATVEMAARTSKYDFAEHALKRR